VEHQIISLAKLVQEKWAARSGRDAPSLRLVVVIWGDFPARVVQQGQLVYVAGAALTEYLRTA
jgi:hypothetical protein